MTGTDPAHISDDISGGSPWKLPEVGGIYAVCVASYFWFCSLLLLHTFQLQPCSLFIIFFLCRISMGKLYSPIIQSFTHSHIILSAFYVLDTVLTAKNNG